MVLALPDCRPPTVSGPEVALSVRMEKHLTMGLPLFLPWFLGKPIRAFQFDQKRSKMWPGVSKTTRVIPTRLPGGQVSQSSNTLVSTPSSQNGLATCSGLKRKSIDESDEDEQEPEAKKNKTTAPEQSQKWACPFQKKNPFKWTCAATSCGYPSWNSLI